MPNAIFLPFIFLSLACGRAGMAFVQFVTVNRPPSRENGILR
jgi:hypothetical protein